jgi:hypothetical protein
MVDPKSYSFMRQWWHVFPVAKRVWQWYFWQTWQIALDVRGHLFIAQQQASFKTNQRLFPFSMLDNKFVAWSAIVSNMGIKSTIYNIQCIRRGLSWNAFG